MGFVRVVVGFGSFFFIKLYWDPTENILVTLTVISTKKKIEHLNTVLHFGGLV